MIMMQVNYGYQYSGERFPPFGCAVTDNTTAALRLRFGPFSLIAYFGTDSVQGVGWLAIIWMSHANQKDRTVVIISRVSLIAVDMILIYITWTALRGSAALTDIRRSKRLTLSDVLFRGGMSL